MNFESHWATFTTYDTFEPFALYFKGISPFKSRPCELLKDFSCIKLVCKNWVI